MIRQKTNKAASARKGLLWLKQLLVTFLRVLIIKYERSGDSIVIDFPSATPIFVDVHARFSPASSSLLQDFCASSTSYSVAESSQIDVKPTKSELFREAASNIGILFDSIIVIPFMRVLTDSICKSHVLGKKLI